MDPLVSILIPAFNSERWIGQAIESALGQTWQRKEIIIVDDGSRDQTLSIAQGYQSAQVLVTTQENKGAAAARNTAYSLSQGGYIQWLDADDILGSEKIGRQMDLLLRRGTRRTLASAPYGHFRHRLERAQFCPTALWCDLSPTEWLIKKLTDNLFMQTATWLVSRELVDAAGPWDTRLLGDDDGEFFCRVILASDAIRFVPDAKVFYRRTGGGSLSQIGQSSQRLEAHLVSMGLHIEHLRSLEDSERVRAACLTFLQRWLVCFYPERPDLVKQLHEYAAQLGGSLGPPRMSWKYAWIQRLLGWGSAKRAQLIYNECKSSFLDWWDATLSRVGV